MLMVSIIWITTADIRLSSVPDLLLITVIPQFKKMRSSPLSVAWRLQIWTGQALLRESTGFLSQPDCPPRLAARPLNQSLGVKVAAFQKVRKSHFQFCIMQVLTDGVFDTFRCSNSHRDCCPNHLNHSHHRHSPLHQVRFSSLRVTNCSRQLQNKIG